MPAVTTHLTIEQGTDFSHGWSVKVNGALINATWTARAQIREHAAATTVLHTFAASVNSDGSVVIAVTPAQSSAWTWRSGTYDVEIVNADASLTLRVAQGSVQVSPEVTR